jgi:hypothetical protein
LTGKGHAMPFSRYALLLCAVLFAAAATVWLLNIGSTGLSISVLPAFLIAALAVRMMRK